MRQFTYLDLAKYASTVRIPNPSSEHLRFFNEDRRGLGIQNDCAVPSRGAETRDGFHQNPTRPTLGASPIPPRYSLPRGTAASSKKGIWAVRREPSPRSHEPDGGSKVENGAHHHKSDGDPVFLLEE